MDTIQEAEKIRREYLAKVRGELGVEAPIEAPVLIAPQVEVAAKALGTTIEDLELVCAAIAAQRDIVEAQSKIKSAQQSVLDKLEARLLETLRSIDKKGYDAAVGKFSVSHRLSVKIPGTDDQKRDFFDYLKKRGLFEAMATVHSQTLNSFYNQEFDLAKEAGNGMDFSMPGIGEPVIKEILSFRRSK